MESWHSLPVKAVFLKAQIHCLPRPQSPPQAVPPPPPPGVQWIVWSVLASPHIRALPLCLPTLPAHCEVTLPSHPLGQTKPPSSLCLSSDPSLWHVGIQWILRPVLLAWLEGSKLDQRSCSWPFQNFSRWMVAYSMYTNNGQALLLIFKPTLPILGEDHVVQIGRTVRDQKTSLGQVGSGKRASHVLSCWGIHSCCWVRSKAETQGGDGAVFWQYLCWHVWTTLVP